MGQICIPTMGQDPEDCTKHSHVPDGEMVDHPNHYGGEDNPYEVIKVLEAWGLVSNAYVFNVVKYLARAGKKHGNSELQDAKKALWYLERYVDRLGG